MSQCGFNPIVNEELCTGCSTCMNACPQNAISIVENSIGHIFPYIEQEKCIDCNICRKVCPSINPIFKKQPIKTFAAWAKDEIEHSSSTSGGIASVVSRIILENKGVVYGCAYVPREGVKHIRVDNASDVNKLKGSKYVQSNINTIFQSVKNDVQSNRTVLFIGTPCQVAGVRTFMRKDYPNFYCADLICHGVPPERILKEYLSLYQIEYGSVDNVSFRENERYCLHVSGSGKTLLKHYGLNDMYLAAFIDSLLVRESCVNCQYASIKRCGDLTLGDFRQLGKTIPFEDDPKGNVSLLFINTGKGQTLIDRCLGRIHLVPRQLFEAVEGNPQLRIPTHRKGSYKKFKDVYERRGLQAALKMTMQKRRLKNYILKIYFNLIK